MNTHPLDRRVFFTTEGDAFLSQREVQHHVHTGKLVPSEYVFDVDGDAYLAQHVAANKTPRWLQNEQTDPMLLDCPTPSASELTAIEELVSEDDFLEMPREPQVRTVKEFLSSEPLIARRVAEVVGCV